MGLPVCLEDIGVTDLSDDDLMDVARKASIPEESIHSMPFPVKAQDVAAAIRAADALGKKYKREAQL